MKENLDSGEKNRSLKEHMVFSVGGISDRRIHNILGNYLRRNPISLKEEIEGGELGVGVEEYFSKPGSQMLEEKEAHKFSSGFRKDIAEGVMKALRYESAQEAAEEYGSRFQRREDLLLGEGEETEEDLEKEVEKKKVVNLSFLRSSLHDLFEEKGYTLNENVVRNHLGRVGFNLGKFDQEASLPDKISLPRAHDFLEELQDTFGLEDEEIGSVKNELDIQAEEI